MQQAYNQDRRLKMENSNSNSNDDPNSHGSYENAKVVPPCGGAHGRAEGLTASLTTHESRFDSAGDRKPTSPFDNGDYSQQGTAAVVYCLITSYLKQYGISALIYRQQVWRSHPSPPAERQGPQDWHKRMATNRKHLSLVARDCGRGFACQTFKRQERLYVSKTI